MTTRQRCFWPWPRGRPASVHPDGRTRPPAWQGAPGQHVRRHGRQLVWPGGQAPGWEAHGKAPSCRWAQNGVLCAPQGGRCVRRVHSDQAHAPQKETSQTGRAPAQQVQGGRRRCRPLRLGRTQPHSPPGLHRQPPPVGAHGHCRCRWTRRRTTGGRRRRRLRQLPGRARLTQCPHPTTGPPPLETRPGIRRRRC